MGGAILLVGPFLAVVGVVAVIIVMRHKSVQTKSMYSSRRQTIERKVRAARQRTLGPAKHDEPDAAAAGGAPGTPTFVPSAFEGPPVAPPSYNPAVPPPSAFEPASAAESQPWDAGPTAPPPPPPPPVIVQQPVPSQPPAEPWTPEVAPQHATVETPAGGGASWSIVGEVKEETQVEGGKKKKKRRKEAPPGGWQLASGNAPDTFYEEDEVKRPSAAMAVAQWAVFVVGLVTVLIGVLIMVANPPSH